MVLVMLLFGGLLVVPGLNNAATGLRAGQSQELNVKSLYTADAAVEHALWKLKNEEPETFPYSYQLAAINGQTVDVEIRRLTEIYGLAIGASGVHSDYLDIEITLTWDTGLAAYVYTLTITNLDVSDVKLDQVVVKAPELFTYVAGSTSGDLTTSDPVVLGDPETGILMTWDFDTPRPRIRASESAVHTFLLNGPEGYSGDNGYLWVVAEREDIGTVGAILYEIEARALRAGNVAMTVEAEALKDPNTGLVLLSSWEVNPVLP